MPVLTFEQPPPNGRVLIDLSSPAKLGPKTTPLHDLKSTVATIQDLEEAPPNAYPVVRLDVDMISEATASRLAASLLGHVLFLKNQIPFPVMQLGRIPGGKTNSRAAKLRTELMASYDTISSHLDTTFSALATALARCSVPGTHDNQSTLTQAHVAILVGPSMGSAKARVIMGIDGLEQKIWGVRNVAARSENTCESSDEDGEEQDGEEDDEAGDDEAEAARREDDGQDFPDESEGEEDDEESQDDDEEKEEGDDEGSSEGGEESEEEDVADEDETDSAPPPPYVSYAEEQTFLRSADRLLSRVLASADAEGNGIASEMSPTQTHILIRAPRIFKHPAWIPRQNVSSALDATLADFLSASRVSCPPNLPAPAANQVSSKKSKIEGVWIATRGGIQAPVESKAEIGLEFQSGQTKKEKVHPQIVSDEDAEMIWWSWDGKFVGFSDW